MAQGGQLSRPRPPRGPCTSRSSGRRRGALGVLAVGADAARRLAERQFEARGCGSWPSRSFAWGQPSFFSRRAGDLRGGVRSHPSPPPLSCDADSRGGPPGQPGARSTSRRCGRYRTGAQPPAVLTHSGASGRSRITASWTISSEVDLVATRAGRSSRRRRRRRRRSARRPRRRDARSPSRAAPADALQDARTVPDTTMPSWTDSSTSSTCTGEPSGTSRPLTASSCAAITASICSRPRGHDGVRRRARRVNGRLPPASARPLVSWRPGRRRRPRRRPSPRARAASSSSSLTLQTVAAGLDGA